MAENQDNYSPVPTLKLQRVATFQYSTKEDPTRLSNHLRSKLRHGRLIIVLAANGGINDIYFEETRIISKVDS